MIRSAAAATALVILSAFVASPTVAEAQELPTEHEVVAGNTLWTIAQQYYGNGDLWRRIYEANRDRLAGPDVLEVGQTLTIPALEGARVSAVEVVLPGGEEAVAEEPEEEAETAEEPPEEMEAEAPATPPIERVRPTERRGPKPIERRTAFWPDTTLAIQVAERPELSEVAPDVAYSAPWLVRDGRTPSHDAVIAGFAGAERLISTRTTARPNELVLAEFRGPVPAVGTMMQTFRMGRDAEGLGRVVRPTGVVRVIQIEPSGAVVEVERLYARVSIGDLVRPLPPYDILPGEHPERVTGGAEARILGFADSHSLYSLGDVAFLDHGAADGVKLGDEYVAVVSSGEGWDGVVEGRLQVIGVHEDHASARIVEVTSAVFRRGLPVRLDRRMR